MTLDAELVTVVVFGRRRFTVRSDSSGQSRRAGVSVSSDSDQHWVFELAGWRGLSFGVGLSGWFLWSARELVVLPTERGGVAALAFETDEDLLAAFEDPLGWVLVCETSIRRVDGQRETARIELADVIESFSWLSDEEMVLLLQSGVSERLSVSSDGLEFISQDESEPPLI